MISKLYGKSIRRLILLSGILLLASCCCWSGGSDSDDIFIDTNLAPSAVLVASAAVSDAEGAAPFDVVLDGSASFDPDGEISKYEWDFDGDGTYDESGSEPVVNHTYVQVGDYRPVLRVTDNEGATDTDTENVSAGLPPASVSAALTATPSRGNAPLDVNFDASGSTSVNSTIVSYDWDLDDDGSFELLDGGPTQSATYSNLAEAQASRAVSEPTIGSNGESIYTISVLVSDDRGNQDTASATVTVNAPEIIPPVAALSADPEAGLGPLDVTFDASASSDEDGQIVSYDWDMDNDGTFEVSDGGVTQDATFTDMGVHTVGVRVTDDDGATDSTTASITVHVGPVADFTVTPDSENLGTTFNFDASASSDADGTIELYEWDINDDGTVDDDSTGAVLDFSYLAAGTYTARLTVTDNDGYTDTTTRQVLVNDPPVADLLGTQTGDVPEAQVTWDASGSTDSDGTIVQYDWDMDNDGTFEVTDGGPTADSGFFSEGGEVTVCVRVHDDFGATDEICVTVTLNDPPTADLVANPSSGSIPVSGNLDIELDASGSSDSDGTIVQYNWDLDNDFTYEVMNGGPTQTVNVTDDGLFTFRVQVVDDGGLTDDTTATSEIITPPTAVLTASIFQSEGILWDASGSFDNNGTIVRYDWDYNNDGDFDDPDDVQDGMSTYEDFIFFGDPGDTKTVRVMVTDDDGLTDDTTHTWTVPFWPEAIILRSPEPDNTVEGLDIYFGGSRLITLDGSTSFDMDGTIEQYDWDLNGDFIFDIIDGPAVLTDQLFELAPGDSYEEFTVFLRVFDNDGLEGFTTDTFALEQIL